MAVTARRQVLAGIDPVAVRRKSQGALIPTFWEATQSLIEANRSRWKNAKHAAQWLNTLETYAKPVIGSKRVDRIETVDVLAVLNPIWHTKAETASRVRQRMETIIDSAIVKAKLQMENPARWKGHLEVLLPKPSEGQDRRGLPGPALRRAAAVHGCPTHPTRRSDARLGVPILTAARTGMTVGARPRDVSAHLADWEIPAVRMKGGIRHVVPLSAAAAALVQPRMGRPLLFPTEGTTDKELSENGMLAVLQRMDYGHVTVRASAPPSSSERKRLGSTRRTCQKRLSPTR